MVIPLLSEMHGQCDARPTATFQACNGTKLILLDDRGTCVNSLPKAAHESVVAENRTRRPGREGFDATSD